ncbi:transmembrane 4 L6 family member 5-like [Trachinotus anak]|uniref:transmembrane 4 L6 family member 5-like n=1 Tax=Trachinotus anak TaxID=443729 RepID=UPI0039F183C1
MFLLIVFAAVGEVGALYSFSVAAAGLGNEPLCKVNDTWTTPFKNRLFTTLTATSCLQVLLCTIQMTNGLFGCVCGTCKNKEVKTKKSHVIFHVVRRSESRHFSLSQTLLLLFPV